MRHAVYVRWVMGLMWIGWHVEWREREIYAGVDGPTPFFAGRVGWLLRT